MIAGGLRFGAGCWAVCLRKGHASMANKAANAAHPPRKPVPAEAAPATLSGIAGVKSFQTACTVAASAIRCGIARRSIGEASRRIIRFSLNRAWRAKVRRHIGSCDATKGVSAIACNMRVC